jgi:hypothetical protein
LSQVFWSDLPTPDVLVERGETAPPQQLRSQFNASTHCLVHRSPRPRLGSNRLLGSRQKPRVHRRRSEAEESSNRVEPTPTFEQSASVRGPKISSRRK